MGDENLTGVPSKYHRAILDANILRRKSFEATGKRREEIIQKLLKRLADEGNTRGEPATDPLFWCLRVWRNTSQAALSRSSLQSHSRLETRNALSRRVATSKIHYSCMAAWACGHLRPNPILRTLCSEIRDQVRRPFCPSTSCLLPKEATAWTFWASIACGKTIPIPGPKMDSFRNHRIRWEKNGFRQHHAEILSRFMQRTWPEN